MHQWCSMNHESEFRIHNPNANNVKWLVFIPTAEMRHRAKDQESRSRTHICKDHACQSQGAIPHMCMHAPCKNQIYPSMQSQEPRAMQAPRAKEQEPKTKSQRPRVRKEKDRRGKSRWGGGQSRNGGQGKCHVMFFDFKALREVPESWLFQAERDLVSEDVFFTGSVSW